MTRPKDEGAANHEGAGSDLVQGSRRVAAPMAEIAADTTAWLLDEAAPPLEHMRLLKTIPL
eukprot:CAMPEP_0194032154 /NCGR_PEP_ID=MMETSP0009_2-20130614/5158_1 /TAXON_ID=210454 /ORGANISM="Grammatophora oceanica, Strain CCMP 410" /LENGTH=60 /DNA_ID=CAMNT_0038672511 /DNA_START=65 /DNA_END=245 /DNA_ORIENTATION=+